MPQNAQKTLIHFSGFEPQSAADQKERLIRSALMSAKAWGFETEISGRELDDGVFTITTKGRNWTAETNGETISIGQFVNNYAKRPFLDRVLSGYSAFFKLITSGAWFSYARHVWRFSLFALFPFVFFTLGLLGAAIIGLSPLIIDNIPKIGLPVTLLVGFAGFRYLFLPYSHRLYTLMQFDDWRFAKQMAEWKDSALINWVEEQADHLAQKLTKNSGDITITSHSMGGVVAAHVIGRMLERTPDIFEGRKVFFVQLGGAVMQSAWIKPATTLRQRVGLIARHPNVTWLEVQCLTDPVNFYKCDPIKHSGFGDLPPVRTLKIRFKSMLEKGHYKRIQFDIMRMHRQFILGPDVPSNYDFASLAFGPLSPEAYFDASQNSQLQDKLS